MGKEELEGRQWWRLAPCHVHFTDALHARLSRSGNAPLDFSITHNLHAQTEKTELYFSLSNTSLKLFSTLTVEPHSRTQ